MKKRYVILEDGRAAVETDRLLPGGLVIKRRRIIMGVKMSAVAQKRMSAAEAVAKLRSMSKGRRLFGEGETA